MAKLHTLPPSQCPHRYPQELQVRIIRSGSELVSGQREEAKEKDFVQKIAHPPEVERKGDLRIQGQKLRKNKMYDWI